MEVVDKVIIFTLSIPQREKQSNGIDLKFKSIIFPNGTNDKEPARQCRRHKRRGFSSWIPWTEESGELRSVGSQRVRYDLATKTMTTLAACYVS